MLRDAGHAELADEIDAGARRPRLDRPRAGASSSSRAFDDTYWQVFRDADAYVREELGFTERHVWEAEMRAPRAAARAGDALDD